MEHTQDDPIFHSQEIKPQQTNPEAQINRLIDPAHRMVPKYKSDDNVDFVQQRHAMPWCDKCKSYHKESALCSATPYTQEQKELVDRAIFPPSGTIDSVKNLHVDFKRDENYQELPTTVDTILSERGKRYGLFKDHANIAQQLKDVMHNFNKEGWARLSNSQREALEMVQHKIGRILNGDPNYDDSWQDIIGYTQLVLDEIHGRTR